MMNVVKYSDYETKALEFEAPANQKRKQTQNILLPVYNGVRSPLIQLPSIEIDMYGVPSKCDFLQGRIPENVSEIATKPNKPRSEHFDGNLTKTIR